MLKRRNKVEAGFNMSSMTDLVFLLLLFFVMASTMSSPNDLKLNLPQSSSKQTTKQVVAKVNIDKLGNYSVAIGRKNPVAVEAENLENYLVEVLSNDSSAYIALHADKDRPIEEMVNVLDIASKHQYKIVIATKKNKK